MNNESIHEKTIRELVAYLRGYGKASDNREMACAAHWLEELANNRVCCRGMVGCKLGNECKGHP